jgi:hypothetical protein
MVIQACAKLEETRRVAEGTQGAGCSEERVRELEADLDALLASYAEVLPEALDGLSGEERMRVYRMLQLEIRHDPQGIRSAGRFVAVGRRADVVRIVQIQPNFASLPC